MENNGSKKLENGIGQKESDEMENDLYKDDKTFEINENQMKITSEPSNPTVNNLFEAWKEGDLLLAPKYQRNFVWNSKKASNLIESILLNIPIPTIFTSESEVDNEIKEEVIDGQQRLTSIFSFIDGKFPDGSDFKLNKLQIMKSIKGKKFSELSKEHQKIIKRRALSLIKIKSNSQEDIKFEMFERLNTNITRLNAQELRNCMYRGEYNDFLKRMAEYEPFQQIINKEGYTTRMLDVELVLLFCAFYNRNYIQYKGNMKQFINDEMRKNRHINLKELENLEKQFKKSVNLMKELFNDKSFRIYSIDEQTKQGSFDTRKLNQGLYLITMYGFTPYTQNQIMPHLDLIKEELLNLMVHNEDFLESLTGSGTNTKEKLIKKFEIWNNSLKGIMGYPKDEPRAFSYELKKRLFDRNPICGICNQKINSVEDAEVDHIICYWKGGKTIPENARLTHRICNRIRGGAHTE